MEATRKIGIISDIHGNDVAFKKVLEILYGNVDEIICLGDMIAIGPNGNEVVDVARGLKNFRTVLGNHERYFLYGFNNPLSCTAQEHQDWVKEQISEVNEEYIKSIPLQIEINHNGKKIIFMHYAKRQGPGLFFEYIVKDVNYEKLCDLFKHYDADIIFYGHEHIASIFEGDKKYINPGSLGCPHPKKNILRYGILELGNEIKYNQFESEYDSSRVVRDIYEKKMPNGDFVASNFYKMTMKDL